MTTAFDRLVDKHTISELQIFDVDDTKDHTVGPQVVTLADVQPERVSWLWPGRLPAGKLVVIDGDPSTGKSTLALDLAAHVSASKRWPDGADAGDGDVLLLSAEDGLSDTIAPRLVAAGADRKRVHALAEVPIRNADGDVRLVPPSLPRDIPLIRGIVEKRNIKLIVVDVLMAYLNSAVDSHRDQDVRGVLHQLAAVADATGSTIVLIRHLNKAGGSNALYRGGGSIGIVGAARAAFLVARDPEDEARRIFAVTKSNLAVEPPALAYRLVDDLATGCARVEWEAGTVDYTAAKLLRPPDPPRTQRNLGRPPSGSSSTSGSTAGRTPGRRSSRSRRPRGFRRRCSDALGRRHRSRSSAAASRRRPYGPSPQSCPPRVSQAHSRRWAPLRRVGTTATPSRLTDAGPAAATAARSASASGVSVPTARSGRPVTNRV